MKSFQIMEHVDPLEQYMYSDLQVLRSAAGYYIGTVHDDGGFKEPGSRDTNYFDKQSTAEKILAALERIAEENPGEDPFVLIRKWQDYVLKQSGIQVTYRWEP
jgi:hypothetical protein